MLIIARRTAEGFTEESRLEISQTATWSVPVFLPDGILIRDLTSVQKLAWP